MKYRIGLVTSLFNQEITSRLKEGARSELLRQQCEIIEVDVPGAIEIPLACQWLLQKGCHGIVACGAVIRGETTHYDLVWQTLERGVMDTMLHFGAPIAMGVLTTENEEQALERAGGKHGNKGQEAAMACLHMLKLKEQLLPSTSR